MENAKDILKKSQENNFCIISTLTMTKFTRQIRTPSSSSASKSRKTPLKTRRALEMMLVLLP